MKRYGAEHAMSIAREFVHSDFAQSWNLFGAAVRRAILDSLVMDALRVADTVDSSIQVTAEDIVAFRALVESTLSSGIKRRNAPPRRFVISEES